MRIDFPHRVDLGNMVAVELSFCNQLCADRNSGLVFAVLAGPSEVRHNSYYLVCRCPLGCIDGEEQLHKVLGRGEARLKNEYSGTADALCEGGLEFAVTELGNY